MGTLFWLIFCLVYPVVLVLANNDTDTYTNTSLFFVEEDDHDYSLLQEDTETSGGGYFEDMILSRLESIDQTYDPLPFLYINLQACY